jgi:peroxiredoxin
MLQAGEPAPLFKCRTRGNPDYAFGSVGGRYVLAVFVGSAGHPIAANALRALAQAHTIFDDAHACAFLITNDPADESRPGVADRVPGIRWMFDDNRAVVEQFGLVQPGRDQLRLMAYLLDPALRVIEAAGLDQLPHLLARLAELPPPDDYAGTRLHAPVLIVPRVFEPEFCQTLIAYSEQHGAQDSGFMVERDGITLGELNHSFKRRADTTIEDEELCKATRIRVQRRLVPEIKKAFQFEVTRMERYIVARYEAEIGGYFRPHRDNTTKGTAHRRFAVTINLDSERYTGGDLRFPEYGSRTYRAPTGGAVVFSCSLLHEATPVQSGVRFCFLPFLYDEAGARIREANNKFLAPDVGDYHAA